MGETLRCRSVLYVDQPGWYKHGVRDDATLWNFSTAPRRLSLIACAVCFALPVSVTHGQRLVEIKGFKSAEDYPPPHQNQMRWLLEGARAQPQTGGRTLVIEASLQTFRETGERQMVIEAPQCVQDSPQRTVSSSGPLRAQVAQGKFFIESERFLWQQTNASLTISNRVHSIVHPDLLEAPSSSNTPPKAVAQPGRQIEIFSDQFDYATNSGLGVYRGHVRVAGTNLALAGGVLKVVMPMSPAEKAPGLQSITVEQDVIMDYTLESGGAAGEKIHAEGQRAIYAADTGLIQVTGQPTWRAEQRAGGGDRLLIDRTDRIFRANGAALLRLPGQRMGRTGPFCPPASANTNVVATTNHFVEIHAANYEVRTNWAIFQEQVRVTNFINDQVRGRLSCGVMMLAFAGTNELQTLIAKEKVAIEQEDKSFSAGTAVYTATNGLLELYENPVWRAGPREGSGNTLQITLHPEEMIARGNAVMRWPAGELSSSSALPSRAPKPEDSKNATNQFAEIFAERYILAQDRALFQGHARIEHPQMKVASEEITVLPLPQAGQDGRMILAEPGVVVDLSDEQGQNFRGLGQKAVYTHQVSSTLTNDVMELTGTPATLQSTNGTFENKIIVFDVANKKVLAQGKYRIRGSVPVANTNSFLLPGKFSR